MVLRTSSYHFMAFAGRLYCFAFSLRSSTKEGKTASNFFFASWDDMLVEQGSRVPMGTMREVLCPAGYAGASLGGSGRNIPANGTKSEALKVRVPINFGAQLGICCAELFRARHGCFGH